MFMNDNLIKKASVVIASLALIVPLASVNGTSVSAHRIHRHVRVARVIKHRNKRAHKRIAKHMRMGAVNSYNRRVNAALNRNPKNRDYNRGFNDALSAKVNHKLDHNQSYERGYLQIIALDNYTDPSGKRIPKRLSRNALRGAKAFYNDCVLK